VIPLKNFERDIPKDSLSANPELGDLNLVFIYMDRTKVVRCARSILYQAKQKRASNKEAISQGHQKYLYDHAQGFRYKDGKFANSKRRLPVASLRRRGMQYLFVSETPVQCSPVPSDNPAFIPWAESLFRFLLDAEGVIIASGIAKGNGWSKINEDLVTIFRDDNELKTHNISELASWFNDFKDPNHWYAKADEKSVGVSTLFVIVRDQKLPPDKNKRELQNKKIKTRISSK